MVEYLLKDTIRNGLNELKQHPDTVDKIFKYSSKEAISRIKQLICSKDIPIVIGFPREMAMMPCYCIILGQEMEEPIGLGMDIDDYFSEDDIGENNFIRCEVLYDLKLDANYIELKDVDIPNIVEGVFNSEGERILCKWDKCRKRIIIADENIRSGDFLAVEYSCYTNGVKSTGSMFNINYRIECWSDNGDLTVYMYHIIKYIIIQTRKKLEMHGLTKGNLSGGDLEPIPEYFPNFIYRRTLIFGALVDNTIESEFDVLQSVNVSVDVSE